MECAAAWRVSAETRRIQALRERLGGAQNQVTYL
jgi:hypothetical protein